MIEHQKNIIFSLWNIACSEMSAITGLPRYILSIYYYPISAPIMVRNVHDAHILGFALIPPTSHTDLQDFLLQNDK